jgi:hypothetical protein
MPDHEVASFVSGVHNLLNDEQIPSDAAQDENNWLTQDGRLKLINGRLRVGAEGAVGAIYGEIFGYKINGTKVHWRKAGTKIQYYDDSAWQDVVTGLTATADYTFANYSSLAGTFTFAFGADGIYKFHNASPTSYLSLYSSAINFKGYALIDRGRTLLWNRPEDKTGLYGSKVDPQNSTVYNTANDETIGTGNGSTTTFTGTLVNVSSTINAFALKVYAPLGTSYNITGITKAASAVITVASTAGLAVGNYITISGVVGLVQINGRIGTVTALTGTTITTNIDSSAFSGSYSSGGTAVISTQYVDNYLGGFTGLTGSINYISGAISVTLASAPTSGVLVVVQYQYESSNIGGVTDFRHSATRLAGEGFVFPQDEGGDAIQKVLIGQDGAYYSLKSQSAYQLTLDETDLAATNLVYRRTMGVPSHNAATSTVHGIVFLNTARPEKPELTILQRNPVGGDVEPSVLFSQFKFANYVYDDCTIDTFDRYLVIACKTANAINNDTILLCDIAQRSVDITSFNARTFANDVGKLYIGSSVTATVYQLYTGYDDDTLSIGNFWTSKGESLRPAPGPKGGRPRRYIPDVLKKTRKLRLKGLIQPSQYYEVYVSYDDAGFQLVGTVRGTGSYVDNTDMTEIGTNIVGGGQVGGDVLAQVFRYYVELKLKSPKFRKRTIKIVAKSIGYVDIELMTDHNITAFEARIPKRYRMKQNVSLNGQSTDQANPSY